MALVLEQLLTVELGDASYLVGDDAARKAALVDPQVDIEQYLERARAYGLAIEYVVQTHTHEDFLSGARALAQAAGAELCLSGHDAPPYGFEHRRLADGDRLDLGGVQLTSRHTPGHTPEHISLAVSRTADGDTPFAVLSGGSLLVDAAGRTDLLGPDRAAELARALFHTLRQFYLALPDGVAVFPTHVHGSPCGAAIGDRMQTTIGFERTHNPLLRLTDEAAFVESALADLPPKPRYYPRLKERNTHDQPRRPPAVPPALPPRRFADALAQRDAVLLDTRSAFAFWGGHIAGALNIGASGHLGIWAGWMLAGSEPLLLVLDDDAALPQVVRSLSRTGFDRYAGYLAGGMSAWANAGLPLAARAPLSVHQLAAERAAFTVLDVRSPQEWRKGHLPGARHVFLPELLGAAAGALDRSRPVAVYCDSGYRASIGASLLEARGFDACSVAGSWQAWTAASLPIEKP